MCLLQLTWKLGQESLKDLKNESESALKVTTRDRKSQWPQSFSVQRPSKTLVKMNNVEEEQPDTLPGFKMQSEHFVLKFVTGLQKGVCSTLLEYETDW